MEPKGSLRQLTIHSSLIIARNTPLRSLDVTTMRHPPFGALSVRPSVQMSSLIVVVLLRGVQLLPRDLTPFAREEGRPRPRRGPPAAALEIRYFMADAREISHDDSVPTAAETSVAGRHTERSWLKSTPSTSHRTQAGRYATCLSCLQPQGSPR